MGFGYHRIFLQQIVVVFQHCQEVLEQMFSEVSVHLDRGGHRLKQLMAYMGQIGGYSIKVEMYKLAVQLNIMVARLDVLKTNKAYELLKYIEL